MYFKGFQTLFKIRVHFWAPDRQCEICDARIDVGFLRTDGGLQSLAYIYSCETQIS